MYNHIGLKVKDLDASVLFYTAALAPLGYVLAFADESTAGFGPEGSPALWLSGDAQLAHSLVHVAFDASTRSATVEVRARARRLLAAIGRYGGPATKLPAENDDARADEFCAPTENSTGFEIFDNNRETKSIVQRSFGRVGAGSGTRARLASRFRGVVRTVRPSSTYSR